MCDALITRDLGPAAWQCPEDWPTALAAYLRIKETREEIGKRCQTAVSGTSERPRIGSMPGQRAIGRISIFLKIPTKKTVPRIDREPVVGRLRPGKVALRWPCSQGQPTDTVPHRSDQLLLNSANEMMRYPVGSTRSEVSHSNNPARILLGRQTTSARFRSGSWAAAES